MLIRSKKASMPASHEITPESVYANRRDFMKGVAATALAGGFAGTAQAAVLPAANGAGAFENLKQGYRKLGEKDDVSKYGVCRKPCLEQLLPDPLWLKLAARMALPEGMKLRVRSTFRSYDEQVTTFQYWAARLGEAQAKRESAPAGHSEHQLGTTADLAVASINWELIEEFGGTPEGKWLAANAYKYGFALS